MSLQFSAFIGKYTGTFGPGSNILPNRKRFRSVSRIQELV
jgi:hypothetical protein